MNFAVQPGVQGPFQRQMWQDISSNQQQRRRNPLCPSIARPGLYILAAPLDSERLILRSLTISRHFLMLKDFGKARIQCLRCT